MRRVDGPTVTVLAELFCRRCRGLYQPGDAELGRQLVRALADQEAPKKILAVVVGGVWAGYMSADELASNLVRAALICARELLRTADLTDAERVLASSALALLAVRGASDEPGADLVNAAESAVRVEQNEVALWAAKQALAHTLSLPHEVMARLIVARVTRDPVMIKQAYERAVALPPDDVAARYAAMLQPTLLSTSGTLLRAGRAVREGDRPAAAALLAAEVAQAQQSDGKNDDLLRGLRRALSALTSPSSGIEEARTALKLVVGHLRRRQRFGQIPAAARAGVDMVISLLTLGTGTHEASLLTELLEALADAGLSEIADLTPRDVTPAQSQARLMELAQRVPSWPDLAACVRGLRGRPALIMRQQRTTSTGRHSFLGLYIDPPDSLAVKATVLEPEHAKTLACLASGQPGAIASVSLNRLESLIQEFLPRSLLERLRGAGCDALLIVPDGPLWAIPWQAAQDLRRTAVTVAPSMSVHARTAPRSDPIRRVVALVDEDAPGSESVTDALQTARTDAGLQVEFTSVLDPGVGADLLVVFGHGTGTGLRFQTGTAENELSALDLAISCPAPNAIIAACWSGAAPPVPFPLNLPAAMLLSGASTVVGGLWPLPARDTAEILAETVRGLSARGSLLHALARARELSRAETPGRWGLAVHGALPGLPEV